MNKIILIIAVCALSGCWTTTPVPNYNQGPTPGELKDAVKLHRNAAGNIERSAIVTKSNVDNQDVVVTEQDKIIAEVEILLQSINIFTLERYAKTSWLSERDNLFDTIGTLTDDVPDRDDKISSLTDSHSTALAWCSH